MSAANYTEKGINPKLQCMDSPACRDVPSARMDRLHLLCDFSEISALRAEGTSLHC